VGLSIVGSSIVERMTLWSSNGLGNSSVSAFARGLRAGADDTSTTDVEPL
jgi:hypothetical protein